MRASDYRLFVVDARRLRRVPEFKTEHAGDRCKGCVAWPPEAGPDVRLCARLQDETNYACRAGAGREPGIFVEDAKFHEYVVELVRRRVSS